MNAGSIREFGWEIVLQNQVEPTRNPKRVGRKPSRVDSPNHFFLFASCWFLWTMTKRVNQIITVDEVSKHNTPEDAWIIIDNNVYDITNFGKHHPGGAMIYQYAGLDATDAFHAFHYGSPAEFPASDISHELF